MDKEAFTLATNFEPTPYPEGGFGDDLFDSAIEHFSVDAPEICNEAWKIAREKAEAISKEEQQWEDRTRNSNFVCTLCEVQEHEYAQSKVAAARTDPPAFTSDQNSAFQPLMNAESNTNNWIEIAHRNKRSVLLCPNCANARVIGHSQNGWSVGKLYYNRTHSRADAVWEREKYNLAQKQAEAITERHFRQIFGARKLEEQDLEHLLGAVGKRLEEIGLKRKGWRTVKKNTTTSSALSAVLQIKGLQENLAEQDENESDKKKQKKDEDREPGNHLEDISNQMNQI